MQYFSTSSCGIYDTKYVPWLEENGLAHAALYFSTNDHAKEPMKSRSLWIQQDRKIEFTKIKSLVSNRLSEAQTIRISIMS